MSFIEGSYGRQSHNELLSQISMKGQGIGSHLGTRASARLESSAQFNQHQMLLSMRPRNIKFRGLHSKII